MRLERGSGVKVPLVLTEDLSFLPSPQVWLLTAACSSSTRDLMSFSVLCGYLYGWDVSVREHRHTNHRLPFHHVAHYLLDKECVPRLGKGDTCGTWCLRDVPGVLKGG